MSNLLNNPLTENKEFKRNTPEIKITLGFGGLIILALIVFDVIPDNVKYHLSIFLAFILINHLYVGFKEMNEQRLVCHKCGKRIKTKIIREKHECESDLDP